MGQLTEKHPSFVEMSPIYKLMDDSYGGAAVIKAAGSRYLRPTYSMTIDNCGTCNSKGTYNYESYKHRANYPEYVKEGVNNMVGLMHSKPCVFQLPKEMEYLLTDASAFGEPLDFVLRKLNFYQLLHARVLLVVDLPAKASTDLRPYIAIYVATRVTNWHDNVREDGRANLDLIVIDECGQEFNAETFAWQDKTQYRVLQLIDGVYKQGVFDSDAYDAAQMKEIRISGATSDKIPAVFCTDANVTTEVRESPLKWLADMCLSIYGSDADYRQNLHMQGQDTLVVKNYSGAKDDDIRTGAGAVIYVDGTDGDAKYIGVESSGLSEQAKAIDNDKQEAAYRAGQFIGTKQAAQESNEAMQTRIAARTITLADVADAGAEALTQVLTIIAEWMKIKSPNILVKPNKDFARKTISGQDLVQIVTARNQGAPISKQSIHSYMAENGLTTMTYEQELALVKTEQPGEVPPLMEDAAKSEGGTDLDKTPTVARTNVDSRN